MERRMPASSTANAKPQELRLSLGPSGARESSMDSWPMAPPEGTLRENIPTGADLKDRVTRAESSSMYRAVVGATTRYWPGSSMVIKRRGEDLGMTAQTVQGEVTVTA